MPAKSGEFSRIARFFAPLAAGFPGALGLSDDAALIRPQVGYDLVVTTDTIVAGVHFIGDEPPGAIAAKLLRVNLSDLAAMGAVPRFYTLNIALPPEIDDAWLAAFAEGLGADQAAFGIVLAGGDSVSTAGPVTLTVTAFGEVTAGKALLRSGATAGDSVFVSGTVGDAALGLMILRGDLDLPDDEARRHLTGRYWRPLPRVRLGPRLTGLASAAIDVSDGLVADLGHIVAASGVGAIVHAASLPLSPAARRCVEERPELLETCLGGGDDYEILFTAPGAARPAIETLARDLDLPITEIGRVVGEFGVQVIDAGGQEVAVAHAGWEHR